MKNKKNSIKGKTLKQVMEEKKAMDTLDSKNKMMKAAFDIFKK